jgi:hypothetical protein
VLVLALALPVAWLNAVRDGAISILFLPLAVAWVSYTGSVRAVRGHARRQPHLSSRSF